MILSCAHINKAYGSDVILQDASLLINAREKVAVVGNNGAGKTTLLDILTGNLSADSGTVSMANGTTFGYLRQINEIDSTDTILDEMMKIIQPVIRLEEEMADLQEQMEDAGEEELSRLYERYARLEHEYENSDGYSARSRVTGVLKGLGFAESEFSKKVHTLSGGEKTRLYLARILISAPDIIFMDEPTNHLDLSSIEWLEGYLLNYSGTVILVSHDRYFLDRIVGKVVDIENAHVSVYAGNYTEYAAKKKMLRDAALKAYLKQQTEIRHQEAVIEKLQSFNREKSIKRAESRKKMLDKVERLDKPAEYKADMALEFQLQYESGKDVLTVEDISKSFGSRTLFEHIGFELKRGEHVALIGDNGTGKTTILKILNGIEDPDEGSITFGTGVVIAYYDQEHQVLDMNKTVFDEIQDTYPDMDNTRVRNTLASFLFTGDDVFKRIGDLSGGERGRVSLAKLMLSRANFLILDEPTNHLDMISKEILEEAVNAFPGTVFYVSHDRYFINRTAGRILNLTQKKLLNYIGNYDYYLEKRQDVEAAGGISAEALSGGSRSSRSAAGETGTISAGAKNASGDAAGGGPRSAADDYRQEKQRKAGIRRRKLKIKDLEDQIAALEEELADIKGQFLIPQYQTDPVRLAELTRQGEEADARMEELLAEWEQLSLEDDQEEG